MSSTPYTIVWFKTVTTKHPCISKYSHKKEDTNFIKYFLHFKLRGRPITDFPVYSFLKTCPISIRQRTTPTTEVSIQVKDFCVQQVDIRQCVDLETIWRHFWNGSFLFSFIWFYTDWFMSYFSCFISLYSEHLQTSMTINRVSLFSEKDTSETFLNKKKYMTFTDDRDSE